MNSSIGCVEWPIVRIGDAQLPMGFRLSGDLEARANQVAPPNKLKIRIKKTTIVSTT